MASSRLVQRKKKRALNCISLFDQVVCKSLKLFQQDFGADETALKLLDVLWKSEDKWHTAVGKLVREVGRLHSEISSLRALQARTQELLETESNRRRHVEHCRDRLRRKIDAIREVLEGNDVDQARRYLENIDKSTVIGDKSVQSTKLEHSAGSLLDTANVSDDSEMDACRKETCGRTSKSRRASSAGHAMDMVRGPLRRSARLSKLRASSAPKIVAPDLSTEHSQHGYSKSPPAGHKRRSDDSDNSYYGVEMKRSLLTIPHTAHHLPSTVTGEDSDSSNFHFRSRIGRQQNTNNATTPQSASFSRLNRPHSFTSKPVLRMELCGYCGRRITFGRSALRCVVCRLVVHPDCKSQLIQTCIPPNTPRTPLSSFNGRTPATSPKRAANMPVTPYSRGNPPTPSSPTLTHRFGARNLNLAELCPKDQYPRIPALVIRCVTEVLARGMHTVGLYRVSGSEKQVRELYEKFFGKVPPVLARVEDIHVVCGCLKMFLRSLTEPLVTYEQRSVLAAVSEGARLGDPDAVQHVINVLDALPAPNRDTLSYIMLHLKSIAQVPDCQMGEENLAKVFGPTLVGYSCPEPQLMQTVTETRTQQAVLRLLFSVPEHIYSAIVTRQPDEQDSEPIDDGHTTYFSPIFTRPETLPTQSATSLQLRKSPHRNLVMSARKRFFPHFSHRDPMDPS